MPPTTASQRPAKGGAAVQSSNGSGSASATPAKTAHSDEHVSGKPDHDKYTADQEALNKEIAAVKAKLDAVRSRISLAQAPSSNDRRTALKSEMDSLRGEQAKFKAERNKVFDELRKLQDNLATKIKGVNAQRQKTGFRNVGEIDDRIDTLNNQVESGTLKLVDEKKALQEITTLKRARKVLESSATSDDAIAADKARIDELKKKLDDPEAKKASERFDALKKEMDELRAEGDKAYQERNTLYDERTKYSNQMDELYNQKRTLNQEFHEAKDKYHAKVQAIRQARQDRYAAEKAKEVAARREEEIVQMREDAKAPAYAGEIEDCAILINFFNGKYGGGEVPKTNEELKSVEPVVSGVKALDLRKADSDFKGMVVKKKDDALEGFFGGSGKSKKKGGKKGGASSNASGTATPTTSGADTVNVPMNILTSLLNFGISPPSNKDDVHRVVADLETKKSWFEANSEAKTKSEIERVEKQVAKMRKETEKESSSVEASEDKPEEEAAKEE